MTQYKQCKHEYLHVRLGISKVPKCGYAHVLQSAECYAQTYMYIAIIYGSTWFFFEAFFYSNPAFFIGNTVHVAIK